MSGVVTPAHAIALAAAGLAAGTINTIVGSGSLITFPTLLGVGYHAVIANVSNTIGLVPGSVSGAIGYRRELSGRWEWMLVSGVIDLVLAGIILAGLPGTAAWALGLLVGVNMIFGGAALIAIALHARSAP